MYVQFESYGRDLWQYFVVMLIVFLLVLWLRKRNLSYLLCCFVFGVYLLFVIDKTLFPMIISGTFVDTMRQYTRGADINLIPFSFGRFGTLQDALPGLLQNILLTIPFGFGVNFIATLKARDFIWLVPAVGLSIELVQLIISLMLQYPYRVVDINDVLMNGLGVLIGYGAFRAFAWLYVWVTDRLQLQHRWLSAYVYDVTSRT